MSFAPAPEPKTLNGRHRILSPSASIRVSPICLGAMNFGTAWKAQLGEVDKTVAYDMMDLFYKSGGNFIDTANNYQDEQSEQLIGEWMKERGVRDQMVVATKYTTNYHNYHGHDKGLIHSNYGGNNTKSLHLSLEASLKKLQTSYIDILYVHWWDFTTSIAELMISLNAVCQSGKVLYLGASDLPAWVVSQANQYARDHALRQFVVYQGRWSAANRDFERDIIPMCRHEGMGLAPWGALGGGSFKTKAQREALEKGGEGRRFSPPTEKELKLSDVLEELGKKKLDGVGPTSIALAYVLHKTPYVFPICGGRSTKHLQENIDALAIDLSPEELSEIDNAVPFDPGFPTNMLGSKPNSGDPEPADIWLMNSSGKYDYVERPRPIAPHKI